AKRRACSRSLSSRLRSATARAGANAVVTAGIGQSGLGVLSSRLLRAGAVSRAELLFDLCSTSIDTMAWHFKMAHVLGEQFLTLKECGCTFCVRQLREQFPYWGHRRDDGRYFLRCQIKWVSGFPYAQCAST